MKRIGTKIINAHPMTRQQYNDLRGWTVPADENPGDDGYLVEYLDGGSANHPDYTGYISWSPKEVFGRAYRPVNAMTFGDALVMLKAGERVCRAGWVDLDAWIKMETASATVFSANGMGDMEMLPADSTSEFQWILLRDCGHISFWAPNQTDILAEDWMLLED